MWVKFVCDLSEKEVDLSKRQKQTEQVPEVNSYFAIMGSNRSFFFIVLMPFYWPFERIASCSKSPPNLLFSCRGTDLRSPYCPLPPMKKAALRAKWQKKKKMALSRLLAPYHFSAQKYSHGTCVSFCKNWEKRSTAPCVSWFGLNI